MSLLRLWTGLNQWAELYITYTSTLISAKQSQRLPTKNVVQATVNSMALWFSYVKQLYCWAGYRPTRSEMASFVLNATATECSLEGSSMQNDHHSTEDTRQIVIWTVNRKKNTPKCFLIHSQQNLNNCDKIWYILSWVHLSYRSVNVFCLA